MSQLPPPRLVTAGERSSRASPDSAAHVHAQGKRQDSASSIALCDNAMGTGTVPTTRGLLLCPAMPGEVHYVYIVCASICLRICTGVRGRCFLGREAVDVVRFFRELPPPLSGAQGSSRLYPTGGGFNSGVRQWASRIYAFEQLPCIFFRHLHASPRMGQERCHLQGSP